MEQSREVLTAFCSECALALDEEQVELLLAYGSWLSEEALPAGGIGPNEAERVMERHVIDSLAMGLVARQALGRNPSGAALDIGSGVGLPGIPLAIAFPDTHFTLLDRSGGRVRLLKRAARVLDLAVDVVHGSVEGGLGSYEIITSRASLPPVELLPHLRSLVSPTGIAVVAASTTRPPQIDEGYEVKDFRSEMLGIRRWMLIMRQS